MGASLLPATIINGQIYFLFGKERDYDENPGWSDFGGGTDGNETFIQTAIREGGEELTGFLGDDKQIKKLLTQHGNYHIDFKSDGHDIYRCHIFPMKYDPFLPMYYNNNQAFLQKSLDKKVIRDSKIFEKAQIKWFSFADIKKHKNQFRKFYQNVIELILANQDKIIPFVKTNKLFSKKPITRKNAYKTRNIKTQNIKTRNNKKR